MSRKQKTADIEPQKTEMETVNHLRLALALQGIGASNEICLSVILTVNKLQEVGDAFTLANACEIQKQVDAGFSQQKTEQNDSNI